MPTIPREPSNPPRQEPHRQRQIAESFGVDAALYDRTRPRYPDALVERIVATAPGREVLDIGCGTGIAARQFRAAGCTVLGVEPDARMAEFARRGGVAVDIATVETWDPAGRKFDAVVSGQAWHWVDPVAGAAKAAEALRRGGRFAAFWNAADPPSEVTEAFITAYQRVLPDSPFNLQAMRQSVETYERGCDRVAESLERTGSFDAAERWRFDWEQSYTRTAWLDQLPTLGPLTQLPAEQLAEILNGVGQAIDALGGSFTMRYATVIATAARN